MEKKTFVKYPVTKQDVEKYIKESSLPVLLDFWAAWCGPCQSMNDAIETVASNYQGKLVVLKIDIDVNKEITAKFNVRSVPNLILIQEQKVLVNKTGSLTSDQIEEFIKENINI